jgi:hypothetical protein
MRIMPTWDPSDAELVVATIGKKPLCVECIITQTGVTKARVNAIVAMLGDTLSLDRGMAVCSACLLAKDVTRLR